MKIVEANGKKNNFTKQIRVMNVTWFGVSLEKDKKRGIEQRKRESGVQCGTAVVTMANAAGCDVSLAAELSWTLAG